MGLLDEAIREHLELKRRGGADPTALAREEHDALAPMFPQEADEPAHGDAHGRDLGEDEPASELAVDDARDDAGFGEVAGLGQETAELDMSTVMGEEVAGSEFAHHAREDPKSAAGALEEAAYGGEVDDASLAWEVPGEQPRQLAPENIAGQERLSFE